MTTFGYTLLGLTVIVAALVAVLTYAVLRFASTARETTHRLRDSGSETAILSAALQDAVAKLKAQEQETSARADASEQLSSQIVESLTAGLLLVDRGGRVETLNPAGRAMLDIDGDVEGADYRELLAGAPPLVDAISECLTTARPIVRRALEMPETVRPSHLGITVSPVVGAGASRGVICLFSDLSAVVDLESQLRLKDTLARLGELTAGMAHEFRNGLATIHGYSRLIDLDALPARYRPYVEGIRQEADALGKVVTNFLNFARPEQLSFTPVSLEAVVRRAVDDLRHELPDGATVNVCGTFGEIQGDEVLLRQVFGNLVRNATEACAAAGVVPAVSIEGRIDAIHHICRVSVDDNGPGIPENLRERVFQPFYTTRSRGTGLGLAIVQKIVLMHDGRVTVAGSSRGGASVQVGLPKKGEGGRGEGRGGEEGLG
jgi:two-component system, NtrC family, nitrogen regulation sensor histidine kinase GlnL